jgi:3'(2'), 5'-bisphosphate nucleotidase
VVTWASLDRLAAIARQAGAAILAVSANGVSATEKPDRSPVTEADHAAHRVIADALAKWNSGIPVISEEGTIPSYDERRSWKRFWLVDPLDGTKEFLSRNGEYTVNIALIEDNVPVMGIVYAPALDLLYLAGRSLGAWKEDGSSTRVRLYSSPPQDGTALVVAESRSHPSPELEAFLTTVPVRRRVAAGSSLKFCWVAEGIVDLYPRFGATMEWDTAAGDCVYRASGREADRRSPLRYNTPSLRHERFVIGQ